MELPTVSQFLPIYLAFSSHSLARSTMRDYRRYAAIIATCPLLTLDGSSSVKPFCTSCNTELPDSYPPKTCPNCESDKIESACARCGAAFGGRVPERCHGCSCEVLLGAVQVGRLNPLHVLMLQERLGEELDRRVSFNRCKVVLSCLCEHAELHLLRPSNSNPTYSVSNYPERRREDFLRLEERQRLFAAIAHHVRVGDVTRSAGVLMLLMAVGGLRWSDASLLRWDEVLIDADGVMFLQLHPRGPLREKSKANGVMYPLPPSVQDVLASLPRDGVWVAPNPETGLPYTAIRGQRERIYATANVTIRGYHAMRHSVGTACTDAGMTLSQTAKQMGHKHERSAERYMHSDHRQANERAAKMEAVLLGKVWDGDEASRNGAEAAGRGAGGKGVQLVRGPELAGGNAHAALSGGVAIRRAGRVIASSPGAFGPRHLRRDR